MSPLPLGARVEVVEMAGGSTICTGPNQMPQGGMWKSMMEQVAPLLQRYAAAWHGAQAAGGVTPAPAGPILATTAIPSTLPRQEREDPLVARWRWNNAVVVTFFPDGRAHNAGPGRANPEGVWKRTGSSYEVNWGGGVYVDEVLIRGGDELWLKDKESRWRQVAKKLP